MRPFDSGYESLSGFAYTYNKHFKAGAEHGDTIIHLHRFTTPLGPMFVGATERGICLMEFTDRRMLETEFRDLKRRLKATILYGENHHTRQAEQEMTEYFGGQRQTFSLSLDLPGSDFQREVWKALDKIPYGNTVSYQALAQQLQRPNGVRAVANAVGANRVAIVIPCHRVIGKNGQLTGYSGGLPRKRWLLEHESHSHPKSN
ncbi:Methylated-DNA--protein-cysteine methyltransferase [Halomonadaceae bacterium LMG 33818]|uniref:methylated-DNA--[protein]-cysteine S-methyltransferase n=1 Tax=Cernens ardua TaxID=3402176 RepID=UPI003EDC8ABA